MFMDNVRRDFCMGLILDLLMEVFGCKTMQAVTNIPWRIPESDWCHPLMGLIID